MKKFVLRLMHRFGVLATAGVLCSLLIVSQQAIVESALAPTKNAANYHAYSASPAPVLVIYNSAYSSNPFGPYLGEILKAEGFNLFDTDQLSNVTSASLANYDSVILAQTNLSAAQATMFSQYVSGGGNLIAMRPDPQLAPVFGLGSSAGTLANGYMAIQNTNPYGQGFPTSSLQLHVTADQYTNTTAQVVAQLYTNATTVTAYPAVTVNTYGSGRAAAFMYDLATSVVYIRQGNPAQAGIDADGDGIIRTVDMYYNWIDLNKMPLPQADIQQRLLARILGQFALAKKPLPRFWYFPNAKNTAVVLTSDAHANPDSYFSYIVSSMNQYNVTTTFYLSQAATPSATNLNNWASQGYIFSVHPYAVSTTLSTGYDNVLSWYALNYGTLHSKTVRVHNLQWQGWVDGGKIAAAHGFSLDYTYYRYGTWLKKPDNTWAEGYMTGSGQPMKLIDAQGQIVDSFEQYTEIADDQILYTGPENRTPADAFQFTKRAIDASEAGDNAAVAIQMHVDDYQGEEPWPDTTLSYAQGLGVPMFNGDAWYNFTSARYNSTLSNFSWSGSQLNFTATIPAPQNGQTILLPTGAANGGTLSGVTVNGATASYTTRAVRGENFAFVVLPAGTSSIAATYQGGSNNPPTVSSVSPTTAYNSTNTTLTVNGTNFLSTPTVQLGSQALNSVTVNASTSLTVVIPAGMATGTYALKVTNPDGQSATLANAVTLVLPPPAPTVTSVSPSQGGNATTTAITVNGTNFTSGASAKLGATSLTGVNVLSATQLSATVPAGLTPGSYSITVTNPDGQSGTLASAFTVVDTIPPVISAVTSGNVQSTVATITWTTNEAANSQVDYGLTSAYGTSSPLDTTLVTSHSVQLSSLTANTTYHYRVRSADAAGNTTTSGDATFTTTTAGAIVPVGDTVIEANHDNNPAGSAEAFQYTATTTGTADTLYIYVDASNTATKVVVGVYTNTANNDPGSVLAQATISSSVKGAWNAVVISPVGITSGAKYWIAVLGPTGAGTVEFRDVGSGGKAEVSSQTTLTSLPATWSPGSTYFNAPMSAYLAQTGGTGDTQPPSVTMTAPSNNATVSGTSVSVSANASDNVGVTSVQFQLDGAALGAPVTGAPYSIVWDTTTAANGTHSLSAQARDAAGNIGSATAITVTVSNNDTTPPVISAVTATNIQNTSATITWTTNEGATSQVDYGTTTAYGSSTSLDSTLVTGHSQSLSGLTASTTYHYRVRSTDSAGNPATSGDFSFTTAASAPSLLVGDRTIEANQDDNPAGVAEAFQYTATASGSVSNLNVYIDSSNTSTKVVVGVYTNTAGNDPGALLVQATITSPVKGAWNTVSVPAAAISSGQKYWIAILGSAGSGIVKFRDVATGGKAETSAQTTLSTLPATWTRGATYANSPMSAYAN